MPSESLLRTRMFVLLIAFTTPVVAQDNLKVYFGNLHSHTSYSDGSGTPANAYQHARDIGHLDFMAITEHNHAAAESGAGDRRDGILIATSPELYNGSGTDSLISAATASTKNGEFVALYGQEFSTISSGNHVNIFDIPNVIGVPNGRFDLLLNTYLPANLDSTGQLAIVQLNHPADFDDESIEYGADDFSSRAQWASTIGKYARLIEVLNGPGTKDETGLRAHAMETDYTWYLNTGLKLAPTGDQDNHYLTWGDLSDARTAVICESLTKPKLLAALRARHVYATEDKNLRLIFRINDHLMGDVVSPPALNSALKVEFTLQDDDEPDGRYEITVFSDRPGGALPKVIDVLEWNGNTTPGQVGTIEDIRFEGPGQYLFFRVTQLAEDGPSDRAWTAPLWFESTPTVVNFAPISTSGVSIASRRSKIYHISARCKDAKRISAANRITGAQARNGRRQHENCPRL
jgi:hypothetical protein